MSTLSFQDYVRTRMLKRRQASLAAAPAAPAANAAANVESAPASATAAASSAAPAQTAASSVAASARLDVRLADEIVAADVAAAQGEPVAKPAPVAAPMVHIDAPAALQREQALLAELRAVKELIEERFGALAFMEKLQRRPAEARLAQKLLDCGFSPLLVRKMAEGFRVDAGDEGEWAAQVLEKNLRTASADEAIELRGGVFALIGATGVGKTTTTAKIAAAFAARHGAGQLGLITLDAYRLGAHEQLRGYGRILGVPVHTAHDRASLDDLLELLAGKKLVLIDTAGMAQRDTRTRELLDMLSHHSVQRLLVVNAASQGETIDDVLVAYRASTCAGMVLSKIDEAIKLGPALDAAIRHRLSVVGVANGQRVPEDWHRLSANALVQRALRGAGSAAWRLDGSDVSLVFAASAAVGAVVVH
jgi:flagellar biosynthesis protein FlhF